MTFIRKYFMAKMKGFCCLFDSLNRAWKERIWSLVVLTMLTIILVSIFGTLILPIDFTWAAIIWIKDSDARKQMEDFMDSVINDT